MDYSDIINLPHPVSKKHPRMSMYQRAAQFAPFAALTGHDAAIRNTAKQVEENYDKDEPDDPFGDAYLAPSESQDEP